MGEKGDGDGGLKDCMLPLLGWISLDFSEFIGVLKCGVRNAECGVVSHPN